MRWFEREGERVGGTWREGKWKGGSWWEERWKGGIWREGKWKGGVWREGRMRGAVVERKGGLVRMGEGVGGGLGWRRVTRGWGMY